MEARDEQWTAGVAGGGSLPPPGAAAPGSRRTLACPAAGWRRFLAPYYAYSAVLIASYWLTRSWFLSHGGHAKYTHVYHTGALFQKARGVGYQSG